MSALNEWLPIILIAALILAGTFWIAHEMGESVGYEHGRNHEHDLSLLRERRVYEGDSNIIRFANETTTDWSNT
jgi:hypothetical protein